jgi:hypothetical protein
MLVSKIKGQPDNLLTITTSSRLLLVFIFDILVNTWIITPSWLISIQDSLDFFLKKYNTFGEFLGYTTPKAKILTITYDYIQLKVGQDARIHKLEYNTMCSQSTKWGHVFVYDTLLQLYWIVSQFPKDAYQTITLATITVRRIFLGQSEGSRTTLSTTFAPLPLAM